METDGAGMLEIIEKELSYLYVVLIKKLPGQLGHYIYQKIIR